MFAPTSHQQYQMPGSVYRGMRFCKECDNMLYAKEQVYDQRQGIARLVFECPQCGNLERAVDGDQWDNCVYRQDYGEGQNEAGESVFKFNVDKDCIKDPTLQRTNDVVCPVDSCQN